MHWPWTTAWQRCRCQLIEQAFAALVRKPGREHWRLQDGSAACFARSGCPTRYLPQQQRSLELEVGKLQAANADLQSEVNRLRQR